MAVNMKRRLCLPLWAITGNQPEKLSYDNVLIICTALQRIDTGMSLNVYVDSRDAFNDAIRAIVECPLDEKAKSELGTYQSFGVYRFYNQVNLFMENNRAYLNNVCHDTLKPILRYVTDFHLIDEPHYRHLMVHGDLIHWLGIIVESNRLTDSQLVKVIEACFRISYNNVERTKGLSFIKRINDKYPEFDVTKAFNRYTLTGKFS